MHRTVWSIWYAALFLLSLSAAVAQSQNSAPPIDTSPQQDQASPPSSGSSSNNADEGNPVFRVKTRMVIVDVVAHDKKGQLITDLKAVDLRILEDGKEQKISVFNFQHPQDGEAAAAQAELTLPQNVFRNTPRYRPNSALNVILLDGLNSSLLEQAYVRSEMIKFLEKLPSGHPVAIYMLGKRLRLLQDFTADTESLKKVIATFRGESSHALASPTGTPEVPMTAQGWAEQTLAEKAPAMLSQMAGFAQEHSSDQLDVRLQQTLAALTSLAQMLSGYPGRKNLIWVSDGIPMNVVPEVNVSTVPVAGAASGRGSNSPAHGRRSYEEQLALLGNLFTDAQVAVYPIDARGLVGSPFFNVANPVSGAAAMGGLAAHAEGKLAEELFQAHSNMLEIAEQTGGRAFYNRNDIDTALRTGIDDGSTYYTLAYYPANKNWNGKFRKIQVSARRDGVKLRYRSGYFAVDRAEYMKQHQQLRDASFGQALGLNAPVATTVQFEAKVAPPSAESQQKVVVSYFIDPHMVSFEHGSDALEHAQVDCVANAFSSRNFDKPAKSEGTRVDAAVTSEVYRKIMASYLPCQVALELPEGQYYLRLGVRDNGTGLIGTVNAEVTVPAAQKNAQAHSGTQNH
ncbi:MAG TPA: VWA domain-containing protein [Terriglobales bacterium]|nr:VWA domain-containing protein [Terriglobales bacterium]